MITSRVSMRQHKMLIIEGFDPIPQQEAQ